jgi:proteasome assembly chaperone (PAC2) family protein
MLNLEYWPKCDRPLLVVALTGWIDAGQAGSGAISALVDQLDGAAAFAHFDLTDLLDLQQTRPTARFDESGLRVIDWPQLEFVHGRAGRDVVVVTGPESSLHWPTVAAEIVGVAQRLHVTEGATLAGMPALVTHRQPPPVLATATSRSLAQEVGPLRPDYAGPTGMQTIVQRALGDAGIPCVGVWAQVPQYVSGSPSPPAVAALLGRLATIARLELDLDALEARSEAYRDRVEQGLAQRPDVKEIVDRLEAQTAAADPAPDGGALVDEIERFLRSQSDD